MSSYKARNRLRHPQPQQSRHSLPPPRSRWRRTAAVTGHQWQVLIGQLANQLEHRCAHRAAAAVCACGYPLVAGPQGPTCCLYRLHTCYTSFQACTKKPAWLEKHGAVVQCNATRSLLRCRCCCEVLGMKLHVFPHKRGDKEVAVIVPPPHVGCQLQLACRRLLKGPRVQLPL